MKFSGSVILTLVFASSISVNSALWAQTPASAPSPVKIKVDLPPLQVPGLTEGFNAVGTKIDSLNTSVTGEIGKGNSTLDEILLQLKKEDDEGGARMTRRQLAEALINYEAMARLKEYQLNMKLLYQLAPGTLIAKNTANNIQSYIAIADITKGLNNQDIMMDSLVKVLMLRGAQSVRGGDELGSVVEKTLDDFLRPVIMKQAGLDPTKTGDVAKFATDPKYKFAREQYAASKAALKQAVKQNVDIGKDATRLFTHGDLKAIEEFDPGALFAASYNLDYAQAAKMIGILTNPMPILNADLQQKLQGKNTAPLTEDEKEMIGAKILEMAMVSMSNFALADMSARRLGENSLMKNLKEHSSARFGDENWHKELASASEAAVLREITMMMAYNQWTQFQNYRLQEQQVGLLATLNATIARLTNIMDVVRREYNTALEDAKQKADEYEDQGRQQLEDMMKDREGIFR